MDEDVYLNNPFAQITREQAQQLLSKRFWNWQKIEEWIESLPQIQELKKQGHSSQSELNYQQEYDKIDEE